MFSREQAGRVTERRPRPLHRPRHPASLGARDLSELLSRTDPWTILKVSQGTSHSLLMLELTKNII